jgi:hypothetical protein
MLSRNGFSLFGGGEFSGLSPPEVFPRHARRSFVCAEQDGRWTRGGQRKEYQQLEIGRPDRGSSRPRFDFHLLRYSQATGEAGRDGGRGAKCTYRG